jgi:hypothetical protein
MLRITERFAKQCSFHLQNKSSMVGRFSQSYIRQAVDGDLGLVVLIGGAEERAAILLEISTWLKKRGDENI